MSLEEIQSPLPPRKAVFQTEDGDTGPRVSLLNQPTEPMSVAKKGGFVSKNGGKTVKRLLAVLLVVGILSGSWMAYLRWFDNGSINTLMGNKVTLKYWGLWEEDSVMSGIIADFEAENPNIKIEYKKNQKDGYRGRLIGRLAKSGESEDVPDIFRIHNTWIPMFRDELAVVPKATVEEIGLDTDYFDVYKNDLKENDQYLSIPIMYDGLVMFYNPDILSKAQVKVPNNWWDLKRSAAKITEKDTDGKIKTAGVAMGTVENVDHWSDIVGLMIKQNGVNLTNLSADNQKKLKDVLNFYTLFKTTDKVWDESLPNSTQYFASGNLAFYFGPSWRAFDIQALNPNLKFGVAAVPQLPTTESVPTDEINAEIDLTNIHWASYWTEGVNNKSKHQKEAWKFLEYLSSVEVLEKMYQADSQIRSFGQIYPRKSMVDKIRSNPKVKPLVDTANNATSWYLASDTWDDGLNTEMQKYFSDAINSILANGGDNEEDMKTLVNGIKQLQQKYKLNR